MRKTLSVLLLLSLIFTNTLVLRAAETKKKESTKSEEDTKNWPQAPKIEAPSAILMDASSGLILYEKNANKKRYPASVTKIMTTLLAIENSAMNETVVFSRNAIHSIEPGSNHIAMKEDEELTMEQCLYAVMLASANEVSNAVGEHVAGDSKSFTEMMTNRAKELGCKNTNFENANGLYNENHYTTAYDLALISREALKHDMFRKVTSQRVYTIPKTNLTKESRVFSNHHQMLMGTTKPQYKYDGCIGGKTGYTVKSKHSLATFASKDGMDLICIVMNNPSSNSQYESTTKLLDYGFDNFSVYDVSVEDDYNLVDSSIYFTRYNSFFDRSKSPLQIAGTSTVILPNTAEFNEVEKDIEYTSLEKLEVGSNVLGTVLYKYGDKVVGSSDITYNYKITPMSYNLDKPKMIEVATVTEKPSFDLKPIIIGAIIVILIILYLTYYFLVEKPRQMRRRSFYNKRKYRSKLDFDRNLFK